VKFAGSREYSEDKEMKAKHLKPTAALAEEDISSKPVSRRSLLGTIGIGAGVAAAAAFGAITPAQAADAEGRGRRCRYRDADRGDTTRVRCGRSDND
jgi:hypothetical protein